MSFLVKAFHISERFNLAQVKTDFDFKLVKSEFTYLLFEVKDHSYIYLKDYGSVVFFNVEEELIQQILAKITPVETSTSAEEEFLISEGGEKMEVGFNEILLPIVNLDSAHIIMLNLAQTVALAVYLDRSSDLLEETRTHTEELERTGRVKLGRNTMRKFIGHTMNFKNNIAENLFIFDTSSLAWTQKGLSDLDIQLKEELDIINRHHALQYNLNVVTENLDLFKDILQHKHSSTLEWIIIILILIEVIPMFIPG